MLPLLANEICCAYSINIIDYICQKIASIAAWQHLDFMLLKNVNFVNVNSFSCTWHNISYMKENGGIYCREFSSKKGCLSSVLILITKSICISWCP